MTEYDIEEALADIGIETAGPPVNPLCYKRYELARELYRRLKDKKKPPEPIQDDDVIIGNG